MRSLLVTSAIVLALPVLVAIALQAYLFAGLTPPPSDYGKGTMFDVIAARYDMINRVLAVGMDIGWRQRMVEKIRASPLVAQEASSSPVQLLDIATGTADVALLLAAAIPTANVTGVDPSENMLHVGRQKVTKQGWDQSIHLMWHDAQTLSESFPDATFDGATMAFGIRNVPNRNLALCQIHRVLKPGARFCILEFSEPDESFGVLGVVVRLFIRNVIPIVGGILSGKPREYWHLQSSIKDFPSPQDFVKMLEGLDCSESTDKRTFSVDELIHMNFGSVQLYVTTASQR
jgi:demethylmenaquinone methyltransferase / 2-methoxy-6-polyprenyl-1,4-benzoquinol methylase